jgi:hypothetical protein
MMKNGKYIPIDEKITDQGITVHLKELFIADSRISLWRSNPDVSNSNGTKLPSAFSIL